MLHIHEKMAKGKGHELHGQHDDDEIYVDRDGIPHFNGNRKELLHESLIDEDKKKTLGLRLLRGERGERRSGDPSKS